MCNHPSALAFPDHVRHYIQTELPFGAIAGPFSTNPLHKPLVCSPLQLWHSIVHLPGFSIQTYLLGFTFDNHIYFDTRCPFGLRTSAMICQRTTKAIIYIFTQAGFSADVYLMTFTALNVRRWLTMPLLLCNLFSIPLA